MANILVTNREMYSRGSMRGEIGMFDNSAQADGTIVTKLGVVEYFRMPGTNNSDHDASFYMNFDDAGSSRSPGGIFVKGTQLAAVTYVYEAIGR